MSQFDVFLSYNSVDKLWVIKLKDDLQRYGVSVWLDKDEIRPGDLFAKALGKGLANSRAVALIVSPEAMASGWVEVEYSRALSLAQKRHLQLIPVILRDAELPGFLEDRNWVDFREESAYSENVWKLVWGITGNKPAEVLDLSAPDLLSKIDEDEPQSAIETTAQNDTREGGKKPDLPSRKGKGEPRKEPPPPPLPIIKDSYFFPNEPSWWESASENDQGTRLRPNLCVYPALPGRPQRLRTSITKREFTVNIQANHVFLEEERRGGIKKHEPVEFSESNTAQIIGDVKWIFTRYAPSEVVRFDDSALREVAISFDPKTVSEAVMVKRERVGSQQRYYDEYYLLVFEDR
jgi:hypothetical protein